MDAVCGEVPHQQSQGQQNHHVYTLAYLSLLFHQLQAQGKPCGLLIYAGGSQASTPQETSREPGSGLAVCGLDP
jgi:hypothetical protein